MPPSPPVSRTNVRLTTRSTDRHCHRPAAEGEPEPSTEGEHQGPGPVGKSTHPAGFAKPVPDMPGFW